MHTHTKEQVNYPVHFAMLMRCHWILFKSTFITTTLSCAFLSSTFKDRLKRHLSVANKISTASCGNKQVKLIIIIIMQHIWTDGSMEQSVNKAWIFRILLKTIMK